VQDTAQHVDKLGVIYLVIACFCWAIYTIAAKPLMSSYSGFAIAGWSMLMSAPFLIALASQPIASLASSLTAKQWGETLFLVSFGSLLGTTMWNYGAKHLSGAVAGSFLYLIPVVAVTAGWILLGEAITPHLVIGGALVLAGVALAQFGGGEKAGG
jgi:drug/metabolite transporter (DMT)-like permease